MALCCVFGCQNRTDRGKQKEGVSFHRFPSDAHLRKQWILAVRRRDWEPSSSSTVCSVHFSENDINRSYVSGPKLRGNAVPTIFPRFPDRSNCKSCIFHGCKNKNVLANGNEKCDLEFYKFPEDPAIKEVWRRVALRAPVPDSEVPLICSDHFLPDDFELTTAGRVLKPDACPVIFNLTYRDKDCEPKRKSRRKMLDPFFQYGLKHCSVDVSKEERTRADIELGVVPDVEIKEEPDIVWLDDDGIIAEASPSTRKSPKKKSDTANKPNAPQPMEVTTSIDPATAEVSTGSTSSAPTPQKISKIVSSGASARTSIPSVKQLPIKKAAPPVLSNLKRLKSKKLVIREVTKTDSKPSGEEAKPADPESSALPDHGSYTLPSSRAPIDPASETAAVDSEQPLATSRLIRAPIHQQPSQSNPKTPKPKPVPRDPTDSEEFLEWLKKMPLSQLLVFHTELRGRLAAHAKDRKLLLQQNKRLEERLAKCTQKLADALRACRNVIVNPNAKKIESVLVVETAPTCECKRHKGDPLEAPTEDLEDVFCDAASKEIPTVGESKEIVEDNERLIKKIIGLKNSLRGKDLVRVVVFQGEDCVAP